MTIDEIVKDAAKRGHGLASEQLEPIIANAIKLATDQPKTDEKPAPQPPPRLVPAPAPEPAKAVVEKPKPAPKKVVHKQKKHY